MVTNDVDVPVEWLYKGSRSNKKKKKKVEVLPNESSRADSISDGVRSRSLSISNASLSHGSGIFADINDVSVVENAIDDSTSGPLSQTTSLNNEKQEEIEYDKKNKKKEVKRSVSLNGPKQKRSIFGSLFGRSRSSSQSQSQPQQSQSQSQSQSHIKNPITVSTNAAVSMVSGLAETITTPNSPVSSGSGNSQTNNNNITASIRRSLSSKHTSSNGGSPKKSHTHSRHHGGNDLSKISLKRVTFAVDKFDSDPPQQLPSRTPRQGNILIPEDMISELPAISVGITSAQKGNNAPVYTRDSPEYKRALEIHNASMKEAEKHQQEAHFAARRIANEVSNFAVPGAPSFLLNFASSMDSKRSNESSGTIGGDVDVNTDLAEKLNKTGIDLPIHMHEHHFEDPDVDQDSNKEITLDVIYTRCCHLREILPIPSTLKQVKDKTAPLQTLKFLNPKPTLIDVLSFCDFISIVPIQTVVFDNVNLTPEMFNILLSSLASSSVLEKISLRNVNMDNYCWKLLCKFLLTSKSLVKIDISQTRIRPEMDPAMIRSCMDWDLFARTLEKRSQTLKPLEEILMNGVNFDNIPLIDFQNFLISFATQKNLINGIRLGLANANKAITSLEHFKFIFEWMSEFNVLGVDFAYNDLSNLVKPMLGKLSSLAYPNLQYFTLNSTNIQNVNHMALMLKALSRLPNLQFLDISNLPQVFPAILPYMYKYLPRFPQLKRLHLDNENMTYKEMTVVCNLLSKCTGLIHVSMLSETQPLPISESEVNNSGENITEAGKEFAKNNFSATLYAFARDSPNLVGLDIDYTSISEEVQSRLALCLMRNMRRTMDSSFQLDELDTQDELLFDGSLVSITAKDVLERLTKLNSKDLVDEKDVTKRYLLKKYVQKLHKIHYNVQETIDDLFEKRKGGELPLQEKENLLRLILLEKNLMHILEIFDNMPNLSEVLGDSEKKTDSNENLAIHPNLKHFVEEAHMNNSEDIQPPESEVLAQRPHLMATDSGKTIDTLTGRPVFSRRSSTTSVASKKQEEEEGELHKWGFYVQQQKSLYPDTEYVAEQGASNSVDTAATTISSMEGKEKQIMTKLPSGPELRSAIIKAKGVNTIEELIQKINDQNCCDVETLYNILKQNEYDGPEIPEELTECERANLEGAVKDIYEKLLNQASINRDTKKVSG